MLDNNPNVWQYGVCLKAKKHKKGAPQWWLTLQQKFKLIG